MSLLGLVPRMGLYLNSLNGYVEESHRTVR